MRSGVIHSERARWEERARVRGLARRMEREQPTMPGVWCSATRRARVTELRRREGRRARTARRRQQQTRTETGEMGEGAVGEGRCWRGGGRWWCWRRRGRWMEVKTGYS